MVTNWSQNILFSARFQGKSATSSPQKNQSEYRDIQLQFQYLPTTIYKKKSKQKVIGNYLLSMKYGQNKNPHNL